MSESIYPGLTRAHNRLVAAAQEASAELRRLHSVNADLLEALKLVAEINPYGSVENAAAVVARAAIVKATKETK